MKIFYCDTFVLPLPENHRFPMAKYSLLREAVEARELGTLTLPEGVDDDALLRVHSPDYLDRVVSGALSREEVRRIGFPWSPGLVERSRRSVGGTVGAARSALLDGAGVNLAGGTHHAFADRGEGFCVFNDVAVAIRDLQAAGQIRRAAVVDLDVHQGNGTASLFRKDPTVFTASVHGASNYPFQKEPGDLDLPLDDGAGDEPFLEAVDQALTAAVEAGRPDLVFYIAGADPWEGDRLGRLNVSQEGLAERDRRVAGAVARRGVPLAVVMGGGYAEPVAGTVAIHLHSVETAARLAQGAAFERPGLRPQAGSAAGKEPPSPPPGSPWPAS